MMNYTAESIKTSPVVGASLGAVGLILVAIIVVALVMGSRKKKDNEKKSKYVYFFIFIEPIILDNISVLSRT